MTIENIKRSDKKQADEGVDFLLNQDKHFRKVTLEERKKIIELLGKTLQADATKFRQAFDLIYTAESFDIQDTSTYRLVEMKTTRQKLQKLPYNFFFGATKNEFDLAEVLGERYIFCFVCLEQSSKAHVLLTYDQLKPYIKTRRTQYQINLKKE